MEMKWRVKLESREMKWRVKLESEGNEVKS